MDVQYYGSNCLTITTKKARIVIDDDLTSLGLKSPAKADDIELFTSPLPKNSNPNAKININSPGEYEVSGVSIYGIPARAHMDEEGKKTAVMYKMIVDDLKCLVTGHIYPELSDSQLESIGMIDVMFIPVGGNGYTLDPAGALKIIKKIEPKLIVPTHYALDGINYSVPQGSLDDALQALGMTPKETVSKLRIKASELGDVAQVVVLERS